MTLVQHVAKEKRRLRAESGGKAICLTDVQNVLLHWRCHQNHRRQLMQCGQEWVRSDTSGLVWSRERGWCKSKLLDLYPNVFVLLNAYLVQSLPKMAKERFKWSIVSINDSFA